MEDAYARSRKLCERDAARAAHIDSFLKAPMGGGFYAPGSQEFNRSQSEARHKVLEAKIKKAAEAKAKASVGRMGVTSDAALMTGGTVDGTFEPPPDKEVTGASIAPPTPAAAAIPHIEKAITKALSGDEVAKACGGGTRIVRYPDLKNIATWAELVNNAAKAAAILFLTESETEGHWICAFDGIDGPHVFDPLGIALDAERHRISPEKNAALGQTEPELTRLLHTCASPEPAHVSRCDFQDDAPGVNTCGRWVALRIRNSDLTDPQFKALVIDKLKASGMRPDEWVVTQVRSNEPPSHFKTKGEGFWSSLVDWFAGPKAVQDRQRKQFLVTQQKNQARNRQMAMDLTLPMDASTRASNKAAGAEFDRRVKGGVLTGKRGREDPSNPPPDPPRPRSHKTPDEIKRAALKLMGEKHPAAGLILSRTSKEFRDDKPMYRSWKAFAKAEGESFLPIRRTSHYYDTYLADARKKAAEEMRGLQALRALNPPLPPETFKELAEQVAARTRPWMNRVEDQRYRASSARHQMLERTGGYGDSETAFLEAVRDVDAASQLPADYRIHGLHDSDGRDLPALIEDEEDPRWTDPLPPRRNGVYMERPDVVRVREALGDYWEDPYQKDSREIAHVHDNWEREEARLHPPPLITFNNPPPVAPHDVVDWAYHHAHAQAAPVIQAQAAAYAAHAAAHAAAHPGLLANFANPDDDTEDEYDVMPPMPPAPQALAAAAAAEDEDDDDDDDWWNPPWVQPPPMIVDANGGVHPHVHVYGDEAAGAAALAQLAHADEEDSDDSGPDAYDPAQAYDVDSDATRSDRED